MPYYQIELHSKELNKKAYHFNDTHIATAQRNIKDIISHEQKAKKKDYADYDIQAENYLDISTNSYPIDDQDLPEGIDTIRNVREGEPQRKSNNKKKKSRINSNKNNSDKKENISMNRSTKKESKNDEKIDDYDDLPIWEFPNMKTGESIE